MTQLLRKPYYGNIANAMVNINEACGMSESGNFILLKELDPLLFTCAVQAERLVYYDGHAAMMKLRLFGELLAKRIAVRAGIKLWGDETAVQVLNKLKQANALSPKAEQFFHLLRKVGNKAAHSLSGQSEEALNLLRLAHSLGLWFYAAFSGKPVENLPKFIVPADPLEAEKEQRIALQAELEKLRNALELTKAEKEQFLARLVADEAVTAKQPPSISLAFANKLYSTAEKSLELDEAQTRLLIDQQLRDAGWEADTEILRHSAGVRPQKGRNLAIAEWPTKDGRADYMLFVGLTPVATVEAKKLRKDVPAALEQAARYSKAYTPTGGASVSEGGPWNTHNIPFLFATNGRPFLKQIRAKSGIWFRDARRSTNIDRPLVAWPSPAGLMDQLRQDIPAADAALVGMNPDFLDLRDYQLDAITETEKAVTAGQRNILLAMATGTGKTRTCIGLLYRFCKVNRFRRILFLVDRTALGEQATETLKDFRLEQLKTFAEIYEVKELGDITPNRETRLHIATIQGMIKRVLYPSDETSPPVDQYDCIIIDECHRGYSLDKEMSDTEMTFRNEQDYISQYSRVLDYFDAVRIGLTATPALHTTEIFGAPVYTYSYRQAVIDGWLVDHKPPVRIVTALAEDGITWKTGEVVDTLDPITGEIDPLTMPDEVHVEIDEFNKRVITESFNRVVCTELARRIDPDLSGKTLIFCATDQHADMVVDLLKQAFAEHYGSVRNDAVVKITGQADKPQQLLRLYKNEKMPSVAVTVDLLTTGIDVPAITNIVFIRRVRSRILYEQMLGRATRLCDAIGKEYFTIYDAVDLYTSMQSYSDMKPVVTQVSTSFPQLMQELKEAKTDDVRATVVDQFLAKFHRVKRLIDGESLVKFVAMTGSDSPKDFATSLRKASPQNAADILLAAEQKGRLGKLLESLRRNSEYRQLISTHQDELRSVESGYGQGEKPADYLESFKDYLATAGDQIPALILVTQKPRELTRKQLRELKLTLDAQGFSEANLRTAWRETTNQEIAASIIGFIRYMILGTPLVPYAERVHKAMRRVLSAHSWTDVQRTWLERIGVQMEKETIVDRDSMNEGAFKNNGGFDRVNRIFSGQLESILEELYDAVWDDAA